MRLVFLILFTYCSLWSQAQESLSLAGLEQAVEIKVDQWGVAHIYAQTEADLFFAQGYYAASDRLFQFEVWRRQANGTVAEILGPRELKRDIGTRLFQFRGDMKTEMEHYHPRGVLIIESFVKGVNAYIDYVNENPDLLPLEFELLDIKPQKWTAKTVISRHQGLLGNIGKELNTARAVAIIGAEKVQDLSWFHPKKPILDIDPAIDPQLLQEDILELYDAYRKPVRFTPDDIISAAKNVNLDYYRSLAKTENRRWEQDQIEEYTNIGSNNWILSGEHTASGYPLMANDPHRTQAVPSLRYMVHLNAPGWNVIGGGEPEIPGISIGHNDYGAWGLTVFRTDAEDLYVYQLNPDNPNQYWYKGAWENMRLIKDTIPVKGQNAAIVSLKYTRHGPLVYENIQKNTAYAVRCGWLEYGGSPYLASLRMDQAKDFKEFQEACNFSHIPGENMIWADRQGNIGWQSVGIAPVRRNWSGMVPVPGDGRYEWDGYLPITAKPNLYNPPSGMFATANENVTPKEYLHWDAIGFNWADPFRGNRVREVLSSGRKHTLADMAALQTDYLSIPARTLVPLLKPIKIEEDYLKEAQQYLLEWDYKLTTNSIAASIYVEWEKALSTALKNRLVPTPVRGYISLQLQQVIDLLLMPDGRFGENALAARDQILIDALQSALKSLSIKVGMDMKNWQYGQEKLKHITLKHPLSAAVDAANRAKLEVGPAPRGGYGHTVNSTGGNYNQSSGASFRIIVDTGDWDRCLATNSPGQSGDPEHKNYRNLFKTWANDQYFPLFFSKEKINTVTERQIDLQPKK
ncbi:MAG: penicillin acylase family protein [Saprospiraceae bacterium]